MGMEDKHVLDGQSEIGSVRYQDNIERKRMFYWLCSLAEVKNQQIGATHFLQRRLKGSLP